MQIMNNKKGVKLLAAIAVFAMILAAVAVVIPATDSSAEGEEAPVASEIVFKDADGNVKYGSKITNEAIGNTISVAYDETTNTYTVTGTVANIGTIDELKAATEGTLQYEYWNTWADEEMPTHAIVFKFSEVSGKSLIFYDAAVEKVKTEAVPAVLLQYIPESIMDRTYYIVDTTVAETIKDKAAFDKMIQDGKIENINLHIDVTVSDSKNADKGYVVVENGNALISTKIAKGTDGASGKWELAADGTLTLTNYNGKEYFDGNFSKIVLVGDNTITLAGVSNAIKSGALTIMSVDGVGSLAIDMTVSEAAKAIKAGALTINGVSVTIEIIEDVEADADAIETYGILATSYDIYDATVEIIVGEENYTKAIGMDAAEKISIRSADINIVAGNRAINAGGSVEIMASEVIASGSELGIRAYGAESDITITNSSKVIAKALGLADGFYTPYGISTGDALTVQSDSIVTTDGLIIYGLGTHKVSANNATIINDGEMMIWNGATFENRAVLENNGTIGVYGILKNSAGEISNNGTIQNYNVMRNGGLDTKASISFTNVTGKDVAVEVTKISPQVDGSFLVTVQTTTTTTVAKPTLGAENSQPKTFQGTMVAVYNGTDAYTYVIEASNDNGIFNLSYDGEKVTLYISEDDVVGNEIKDNLVAVKKFGTDLFTNCNSEINVAGGKLVNSSNLVINDATTLVSGGELVNSGDMAFNANVIVSSGKISGNDVPLAKGVEVTLSGTVDLVFTNTGSYTPEKTASVPNPTPVEFSNAIQVTGTPSKTVVKAPVDADKGVMTISVPNENKDSKKAAQVVILKGTSQIKTDVELNMVVLVASGATLKIVGTVNVTDGVIGVQDGATINMKISGNKDTVGYGTLNYVISFVNEGYTYYGSLQYALANAAEGATLNLNSEADINVDTVVKKGITLAFAENAKLNIANDVTEKITVSMEEGAKFVLAKGASIAITGGKATVSGNIVYDANEIVLDKVVFTIDATISASVATKTEASAIKIVNGSDAVVTANDGKITVAAGNATGKLTLVAVTDDKDKLKNTANLAVSAGAVSKITLIDNAYTETVIDGTMTSAGDLVFVGTVSGDGTILLADGKKVTFTKNVVDIAVTNGADSIILDKVSGQYFDENGDFKSGKSTTLYIQSFAKTSTKDAYLDIYGDVLSGTITINGNASMGVSGDIFDLGTDAIMIVPTGSTLTVVKYDTSETEKNTVTGLLKVAGTINMYNADDSDTKSYGKLNYQITYTDGEYTVYTMLNTGVNNAKAGDSFTVNTEMSISEKMNIPAGVSITVAEDAAIKVENGAYITIGTPITTLGASGSSISGKVILLGNAFLIAYNDGNVDLSKASIVAVTAGHTEVAAKNSQYNMLNEIYATVYIATTSTDNATLTAQQNEVETVLVPTIDGYRFLGWEPLVEEKLIGQTDFDANMKANMVQITFQKAEGISYYVDNEKMNIIGAPVYVAYGATITAVADAGYTGTPLVNGKTYITVDNTLKTVVGSGVSPAEPVTPVTPVEPEKKDDGMGLTDILLIVLVILAAILVIVVAIRMMRS